MADLRKSVLGIHSKRSGLAAGSKQNFTPIKWTKYFDKEETIHTEHGKFHVYSKGNEGPILLCLHGGGYSGLTWSLFADEILKLIHCQVKAIDFRGHGNTSTDNDLNLSLETLSSDVVDIANNLAEKHDTSIILMGHSMGGAVAVEAAYHIKSVLGLCVIDVVEGTALDALSSMQSILRGRPSHFKSLLHAIQWCYKGGQTHNLEAARVSMPGQVINMKTGELAANDCDNIDLKDIELSSSSHRELVASAYTLTEVAEEVEIKEETTTTSTCTDCGKPPLPKTQKTDVFKSPNNSSDEDDGPQYTWRIDLSKTEQFWTGWFKGLSQKFLDLRVPKLLLLANIHGLDTTLTVGQMQGFAMVVEIDLMFRNHTVSFYRRILKTEGKFQMQVLAKSGHAIHEDQPHNVAEVVSGYLVKQKLAEPKSGYIHPNLPAC